MYRVMFYRFSEALFRHPLIASLPIAFMLALGALFVSQQEELYIASANIAINPSTVAEQRLGVSGGNYVWKSPAEKTSEEINELLASESMIVAIISMTDLQAQYNQEGIDVMKMVPEIRHDVWAAPIGDYHFSIAAKATSPVVAKQLVEGAVETFLAWRARAEVVDAASGVEFFQNEYATDTVAFEEAQTELLAYVAANPEPIRGRRTELELLELRSLKWAADQAAINVSQSKSQFEYSSALLRLAENAAGVNFKLVEHARIPTTPASSLFDKVVTMMLFGIAGTALSFGLIAIYALLDRTIRFPVDAEQLLGYTVLARIPIDQASRELM